MYHTSGIDSIATITELRSKTTELIEHVRERREGLLIQKNNDPYAVLLDWESYQAMKGDAAGPGPSGGAEPSDKKDRPPQRPVRKPSSSKGAKPMSG